MNPPESPNLPPPADPETPAAVTPEDLKNYVKLLSASPRGKPLPEVVQQMTRTCVPILCHLLEKSTAVCDHAIALASLIAVRAKKDVMFPANAVDKHWVSRAAVLLETAGLTLVEKPTGPPGKKPGRNGDAPPGRIVIP